MNFIFHETSIINVFFLIKKKSEKMVVPKTPHFIFRSKPYFEKTVSAKIYKLCLY